MADSRFQLAGLSALLLTLLLVVLTSLGCRQPASKDVATETTQTPDTVEWRFDEPQPDWKALSPGPVPGEYRPVPIPQTDEALQITLEPSMANANGWLQRSIVVEVPAWDHRDWADVWIRVRSPGPARINVGFNPGGRNPVGVRGVAGLLGDNVEATVRLPLEPRQPAWETPVDQLGIEISARNPLTVEILSIAVVPVGAAHAKNATEAVLGQEFGAAVSVPGTELTVDGVFFIPQMVARVRGVIAVLNWGRGGAQVYESARWRTLSQRLRAGLLLVAVRSEVEGELPVEQQPIRNAGVGGGEGLLLLMERLAEQSGHPEVGSANLLPWGYSAAGSFALTFAAQHPERTIGFVRYHSHLRDLPVDLESAAGVPALLLAGDADETAGVEDSEALWKRGRALGAPWTFGIEPGMRHGASPVGFELANQIMIPWVSAVFELRGPPGDGNLWPVDARAGWLANLQSGSVFPFASYPDVRPEANWLPDEATAHGWRVTTGFAR